MSATAAPQMQVIRKSVSINAAREQVWKVLTTKEYLETWCSEFCPGGVNAEIDWRPGGKAVFTDNRGFGMVGKIQTWQPGEALTYEFDGMITEGKEDVSSPEAKAIQGTQERYRLAEESGKTRLEIEADMSEEYFEMVSESWERALKKIKSLAEA